MISEVVQPGPGVLSGCDAGSSGSPYCICRNGCSEAGCNFLRPYRWRGEPASRLKHPHPVGKGGVRVDPGCPGVEQRGANPKRP